MEGWIQRDSSATLTAEEQQTLAQGTPEQKLEIYFAKRIWHEALELLLEQRRQNPDDVSLNPYWQGMMEDDILQEVAEEPVVETHLILKLVLPYRKLFNPS